MASGKKNKGKGKATSRLKRQASVHDLRKESLGQVTSRLQPDLQYPVACPKYEAVIHCPEDKDTDNASLTTATQIRITGEEAVDGPATGTQEATPAIPKTPRTTRRRPGMSSFVCDSGYREAEQLSSIGMGAPSRSAS